MSETQLVLASKNQKKLDELKTIFTFPQLSIASLADFGTLEDVIEDGETFNDNAAKKALGYAAQTGCLTIADDSGLCIDFLDGRPGVYSARYAGESCSDEDNCAKVLSEMEGCADHARSAHFVSAVAIAMPGQLIDVVVGTCHGFITRTMQGDGGFGYDPIFYYPAFNATFGQVDSAEKHRVSHRAMALESSYEVLERYLAL